MEHLVTNLVEINTRKMRVEIDYDLQFSLYRGEIRRFHIEKDALLTEKAYHEIMDEILPKRARERCLNLLERRSMTECELRRKLKEGYYPEMIIDASMELLSRNHLINDSDYAERYVDCYGKTRSKRQIKEELLRKGVDRDRIAQALSESEMDEEANIRRLMEKKGISAENSTEEAKNKFCAFLLRKGYDYDKIRKIVLKNFV